MSMSTALLLNTQEFLFARRWRGHKITKKTNKHILAKLMQNTHHYNSIC